MSLFIRTNPPRLHKQTWAERHRFEILITSGILIILLVIMVAVLTAEPTITGVV